MSYGNVRLLTVLRKNMIGAADGKEKQGRRDGKADGHR